MAGDLLFTIAFTTQDTPHCRDQDVDVEEHAEQEELFVCAPVQLSGLYGRRAMVVESE